MTDETNKPQALSRRGVLMAGAYAACTAAALGVVASEAEAQVAKKASHSSSGYRDTPNAGKSCATCRQFQPPSACAIVEGPISANGYCNLYAKKA